MPTISALPGARRADGTGFGMPGHRADVLALRRLVQGGNLSLEESLTAYRRGAALVAFCQQQLEKVEQQVRVLDGETLKPLPMNSAGTAATESGDDL